MFLLGYLFGDEEMVDFPACLVPGTVAYVGKGTDMRVNTTS